MHNFKSTAVWMYRLAKQASGLLAGSNRRFLLLSPPMLKRQYIYDVLQSSMIQCEIRDFTDYRVLRQIFVHHDYDIEKSGRGDDIKRIYREIVGSGKSPLIIDCGGHIGLATRYFCETFKEALVVCVEPDESNLNQARKNNASAQASFLLAGVGSSDSKAIIQDPGIGTWGYRVETCDDGTVDIVTIENILKRFDSNEVVPFIIKIDIEGFEDDLFERNTDWIDLFPMVVIELHDRMFPGQAKSRNFLREISGRTRDFAFDRENAFSVSNTGGFMDQAATQLSEESFVRSLWGVRYQVKDVSRSIDFYTRQLGFRVDHKNLPAFGQVSNASLKLILSGPGASGSRPMPDGQAQEPGGWNRVVLEVADLPSRIETLRAAGLQFRNEMEVGPGGKQILLEDPDGNPIELFEPAR